MIKKASILQSFCQGIHVIVLLTVMGIVKMYAHACIAGSFTTCMQCLSDLVTIATKIVIIMDEYLL